MDTWLNQSQALQLANIIEQEPWVKQVMVMPVAEMSFCFDDLADLSKLQQTTDTPHISYGCWLTWLEGAALIASEDAWNILRGGQQSMNAIAPPSPAESEATTEHHLPASLAPQLPQWYQRLHQVLPSLGSQPATYKGITIRLGRDVQLDPSLDVVADGKSDDSIVASFLWDGQDVRTAPQPTVIQALSAAKHAIEACIAQRRDGYV